MQTAIATYKNKKALGQLIQNALACDFSWEESARDYVTFYKKCLQSA